MLSFCVWANQTKMEIKIKKEFELTEEQLLEKGKQLDKADEDENTESRKSMLMWLGFTMGLPRELSFPIVEHIHKFYREITAEEAKQNGA